MNATRPSKTCITDVGHDVLHKILEDHACPRDLARLTAVCPEFHAAAVAVIAKKARHDSHIICEAVRGGHVAAVKAALAGGGDRFIYMDDPEHLKPLQLAAYKGNPVVLCALLAKCQIPETEEVQRYVHYRALNLAATNGDAATMKLLLKAGLDGRLREWKGCPLDPLIGIAVMTRMDHTVIAALVKADPQAVTRTRRGDSSAIEQAIEGKDAAVLALLLHPQTDMSPHDWQGRGLLALVGKYGTADTVPVVMQHYMDTATGRDQRKAFEQVLTGASRDDNVEAVQTLFQFCGARMDLKRVKASQTCKALPFAASKGRALVVHELIAQGMNLNVTTSSSQIMYSSHLGLKTALGWAREFGWQSIVEMLEEATAT
jgi:ankyrin repeat protein